MAHRLALAISLALSSTFMLGCDAPGFTTKAKAAHEAAKPPPVGTATTTSADGIRRAGEATAQTPSVFTPGLSVSDAIAQACGIAPRSGAAVTPNFEYDSAALADEDRKMLADVARCLTVGALKGRAVTLIGRADARGEPEYNMTLGESRANAVQRYMVDLGVNKDAMHVTSRGEMDAVGANEEGWARDRRVDIELVR
jgi:peptidoglycan-associated lipoprotein